MPENAPRGALYHRVSRPRATPTTRGAWRLRRSITPDMLVLWDRGFHEYDLLCAVRARGAHVLGRLPANVQPSLVAALPDGSWLAYLLPGDEQRRQSERHLVRLISYTFEDPAVVGHGELHRLVTTLGAGGACAVVRAVAGGPRGATAAAAAGAGEPAGGQM